MASMLATIITVIADRKMSAGDGRRGVGPFGRGVMIWAAAFLVLAVAVSATSDSGVALVMVPFVGASGLTLVAEGARRAMRGRR